MTAEQKQKFEGQIEMAIKPAMGNIQTILESVVS